MPSNTPPGWVSSRFDTTVPHSARVWNYWLGGKDHYPADRDAGDAYAAIFPRITHLARTSRYFLARAVRFLAADTAIRQFVDIGTGLPTVDNTHDIAQRVAPHARIVYVDNDPIVLSHARALLTSSPDGSTDYAQPVALMLMGIMGHIPDEHAYPIVSELIGALPPGSYLALYDGSNVSAAFNAAQDGYNQTAAEPYYLRSPAQIGRFFDGLDLVAPGVVPCSGWRPDLGPIGPRAADSETFGGVGCKP
jgi:hypothetical protein